MPTNATTAKPARKIIAATNAKRNASKPALPSLNVMPVSAQKPVIASDGSTATNKAPSLKAVTAAILADIPAKPETSNSGGGYVNRAATKPQLYGADNQSPRDLAYLRFFASFLRGKAPTSTIAYADIVARQRGNRLRNPLPQAGGKNGCCDRGILSRFDKFGYTVNVLDTNDKTRRIGFRFTDAALALAAVKLGMRDTYTDTGAIDKLAV